MDTVVLNLKANKNINGNAMKTNFNHHSLTLLAIVLIGISIYAGCDKILVLKVPLSETEEITLVCATIAGIPFLCGLHKKTTIEIPVEVVVEKIIEVAVIEEKIVEVEVEKIVTEIQIKYVDKEISVDRIVDEVLARLPEGAINDTPTSEIVNQVETVVMTPQDPSDTQSLVATTVSFISGGGQSAEINKSLANALVVEVRDQNGGTLSGVTVSFSVVPGGSLNPTSATTDTSGQASTSLTLGSTAETYTVTASVSGITAETTATATEPPRATTLSKVSGDGQSGSADMTLANPLVVKVLDQYGNPLSGVTVNFSIDPPFGGEGSLTSTSATTDADGQASTSLTLDAPGIYTVTASVSGIPSVTFTTTPPGEGSG